MITATRLAAIIEHVLIESAPRGRSFFVTNTQCQRASEAVLALIETELKHRNITSQGEEK